jgi:mycofactocin system transcriptional regulator
MNLPLEQPDPGPVTPAPRLGRAPATTHGKLSHIALELFAERGYDETTIDDIVRAAGIGRRTFFRYFTSKNELPWGEFGGLLAVMRAALETVDDDVPIVDALRQTVVQFNDFPESERDAHRGRMSLLFSVPSLMAYSTLKYADWRAVIAEYVARKRGESPDDLTPQAVSWACLGLCLASYERWLADPESNLLDLIDEAFATAEQVFGLAEH